jgi:hypothetical protein
MPPLGCEQPHGVHELGTVSEVPTPPAIPVSRCPHPKGHATGVVVPVASAMGPWNPAGTGGTHIPPPVHPLLDEVLDAVEVVLEELVVAVLLDELPPVGEPPVAAPAVPELEELDGAPPVPETPPVAEPLEACVLVPAPPCAVLWSR